MCKSLGLILFSFILCSISFSQHSIIKDDIHSDLSISKVKKSTIISRSRKMVDTVRVGNAEVDKVSFALKTNLLFDIAITPNLELEIPLGERWSLNAEYQYGWWLKKSSTFCWQLESGGIELRRWFGNRSERKQLTGWFAGVFLSAGIYDFQLKEEEGCQGEYIAFPGLSLGYTTCIGKNLRMEFSAGFGYWENKYTKYCLICDDLYKDGQEMITRSLMLSKAKVSLVWVINKKSRRGK